MPAVAPDAEKTPRPPTVGSRRQAPRAPGADPRTLASLWPAATFEAQ